MAQRTWMEHCEGEGAQANRWDMLLDGDPVEGAYVLMKERGCYELHFPRMSVSTVPSLPAAMKALENAPLLASKGIKIGRPAVSFQRGRLRHGGRSCWSIGGVAGAGERYGGQRRGGGYANGGGRDGKHCIADGRG